MSRPLRVEFPGAVYHVFCRGVNRQTTFFDDQDRRELLNRVGKFVHRGFLEVYSYCLMTNHFHLLCATPLGGLGRILRTLLSGYSRWFNQKHQRVGHLWQGRYRALLVQDGFYLLTASRYIHLNPAPALADGPGDYFWSSYQNYLGRKAPVDWVDTSRVLSAFPDVEAYVQYVEGSQEVLDPFKKAAAKSILGDEGFIRRVLQLVSDRRPDSEVPALQQLRLTQTWLDPRTVDVSVQRCFADVSVCKRRQILVFALAEFTTMRRVEIARQVGRTPGAVTKAVKSIKGLLNQDKTISARLGRLMAELGHGKSRAARQLARLSDRKERLPKDKK